MNTTEQIVIEKDELPVKILNSAGEVVGVIVDAELFDTLGKSMTLMPATHCVSRLRGDAFDEASHRQRQVEELAALQAREPANNGYQINTEPPKFREPEPFKAPGVNIPAPAVLIERVDNDGEVIYDEDDQRLKAAQAKEYERLMKPAGKKAQKSASGAKGRPKRTSSRNAPQ